MKFKILIYGYLFLIFAVSCNKAAVEPDPITPNNTTLKAGTIGAKYYVAKTGNNSNAGTSAAPYLTITKGLSVAVAGDTVFVKAGSYPESVQFTASGTLGHPIVLKSFGTDVVTVDAQNSQSYCIYSDNQSYFVTDGINVQNSTSSNFRFDGCSNITMKNASSTLAINSGSSGMHARIVPSSANWATNITLQNITATGGAYGVYCGNGKIDGLNILGGSYSHTAWDGLNITCEVTSDPSIFIKNVLVDGVELSYNLRQGIDVIATNGVTLRNINSHHNGATGIQLENQVSNGLIEDFLCEYNSQNAAFTYETGVWIDASSNITIRRGIMRHNQTGFRVAAGSSNILAYDLLIYSNQDGFSDGNSAGVDFSESTASLYNSVIDNNSLASSNRGDVNFRGAGTYTFKNNIISNAKSAKEIFRTGTHTLISDNNLLYNTRAINIYNLNGYVTWAAYKTACSQDSHSLNANPLFISSTNYNLQSTSPAINAGVAVGVSTDYAQNAFDTKPDIGAYEANSSNPTPTVYYNVQSSATATKNSCAAGYTGSTVTYTVAAKKYSSTVSQADADSQATTDLNTNKQTYANTNGTCTAATSTYYSAQASATAIKNSCGTGYTGSTVTYTVAAKKYSSTVSQADADSQASTDLNTNKQTYANTNGTCTAATSTYYSAQVSATAIKNSCGTGYTGSTVTYTVSASKYSSTVSQADADGKATTDLSTNKQSYANTNGSCTAIPSTVYYNVQVSATVAKNSCGTGYTGSRVTYTVATGKYNSTISQADANAQATADLSANKQSYANLNGYCTKIRRWGH